MPATIETLWPRWMVTVGAMADRNILMRSQCRRCGALFRVDPADLAARHGRSWSPIDQQERCHLVGCEGAAFYLAARRYGMPWRMLVGDPTSMDDRPFAVQRGGPVSPPARDGNGRG